MYVDVSSVNNYNLKSYTRYNNTSHMHLSGYVGQMTIFSRMFTTACCLVVCVRVRIRVRIRFRVWLVG